MMRFCTFLITLISLCRLSLCQAQSALSVIKVDSIQLKGKPTGISADGKHIFITGDCNQGLIRYDIETRRSTTISEAEGAGYRPLISADGNIVLHRESSVTPQHRRLHKPVVFFSTLSLPDSILNDSTLRDSIPVWQGRHEAEQRMQLQTMEQSLRVKGQPGAICVILGKRMKMLSPNGTDKSYIWTSLSPDGKHILYYVCGSGAYICNLQGNEVQFLGHNVRGAQWVNDNTIIGMNDQNNVPFSRSNLVLVTLGEKISVKPFLPKKDLQFPFCANNLITCCGRNGRIYLITINQTCNKTSLNAEQQEQLFASMASLSTEEMARLQVKPKILSEQTPLHLEDMRIYLNPGHGSWGPKDRPKGTIPYPCLYSTQMPDTLGFYESNTNLWNALYLGKLLEKRGAKVFYSRTSSGPWPFKMVDGEYPGYSDENYFSVTDYTTCNRTMNEITEEVEAGDYDLFLSLHSNSATEGSAVNYPLYLYRGPNTPFDEKQSMSRQLGESMWRHTWQLFGCGLEFFSHYGLNQSNVRGDWDFYKPDRNTRTIPQGGYLGVMKHGCPGGLWEGFFHSYPPARHRALNPDYNRLEALCYFRGLLDYFGEPKDKAGTLCGTVKDDSLTVKHKLFKYAKGTHDQYLPCNNARVTLTDSNGKVVSTYQVDRNWNGFFVFFDLKPGRYSLKAECNDYNPTTIADIDVPANQITCRHINMQSVTENVSENQTP